MSVPAVRPRPATALAATLPLLLIASGCGYLAGESGQGLDPDSAECEPFQEWQGISGTVDIYASIRAEEGQRMQRAWQDFTDCTDINIQYEGSGEFEAQIQVKVDGGNAPDIAFFPQPGLLARFAEDGEALPLPDKVRQRAEDGWTDDWLDYARTDGELYGTPLGANVKSLVWYSPEVFDENGYEIPQTWSEMTDLSDRMVDDGITPWCAGIESGEATGWPATDWVENVMLREHGPEVYDQWVNHEIPFDDPKVADAFERVDGILRDGDYVNGGHGGVKSIVTTSSQDAGLPILDNECGMHMQGSFYAANWPDGTDVSEGGEVFAFNLPPIGEDGDTPVLGGGEFTAAFTDRPEVVAVQEYLATVDYADRRAAEGAWFSAHQDLDLDGLDNPNDRYSAELLRSPDTVLRWDGSDNMPAAVGAGTFWRGMTNWINGDGTEKTLTYVEDSWPD